MLLDISSPSSYLAVVAGIVLEGNTRDGLALIVVVVVVEWLKMLSDAWTVLELGAGRLGRGCSIGR